MAVDDLATQGAMASTAMILTNFSSNIPVSALEALKTKHDESPAVSQPIIV